jgi:hypothetical protein
MTACKVEAELTGSPRPKSPAKSHMCPRRPRRRFLPLCVEAFSKRGGRSSCCAFAAFAALESMRASREVEVACRQLTYRESQALVVARAGKWPEEEKRWKRLAIGG